jgi:hypothetical protein
MGWGSSKEDNERDRQEGLEKLQPEPKPEPPPPPPPPDPKPAE